MGRTMRAPIVRCACRLSSGRRPCWCSCSTLGSQPSGKLMSYRRWTSSMASRRESPVRGRTIVWTCRQPRGRWRHCPSLAAESSEPEHAAMGFVCWRRLLAALIARCLRRPRGAAALRAPSLATRPVCAAARALRAGLCAPKPRTVSAAAASSSLRRGTSARGDPQRGFARSTRHLRASRP